MRLLERLDEDLSRLAESLSVDEFDFDEMRDRLRWAVNEVILSAGMATPVELLPT